MLHFHQEQAMSQTQQELDETQRQPAPQRTRLTGIMLGCGLLVAGSLIVWQMVTRTTLPSPSQPPQPAATLAISATVVISEPAASALTSPLTAPVAAGAAPALPPTSAVTEATAGAVASPLVAPAQTATEPGEPPVYTYEVINVYPHDPNAFTQGLVFDGETLYEGTGLNGRSSLRRVELTSGQVVQQVDLPQQFFGEGITVWEQTIVQLTWQSRRGFVYDKTSFAQQAEFTYPTEGWGITHDGRRLIMSDGSATLYFWDPATFRAVDSVNVYDLNGPVTRLNELEYIEGEIFANIWQTDRVVRIDPITGQVLGWLDLSGLLTPEERATADVLNGIAYQPAGERLFVTGKLWPKLFEIRLVLQ
jgi:glutaminyl-peptide cyclotransferase